MRLRSRNRPNMFVGRHEVEVYSIAPTSRGELYFAIPSCWSSFDQARALSERPPPSFPEISSAKLEATNRDSDLLNMACCEMFALVLCAFWACVCLEVADGFTHDLRSRLFTTYEFGILHSLLSKVAEFPE